MRIKPRPWHRWFAWYPVELYLEHEDSIVVWLEWVERQTRIVQGYNIHDFRPIRR